MNATDATRLAGDSYSTRLARNVTAMPDDKTRIAQEGYQSKLARDAASAQPDVSEFYKVGEKICGRYEVSAIHHGAMGVVYGCFDHETKLPRALKTVRARYAHDKQVLSMFEGEATVWISLEKHPYIVRAYLVERFKNLPYVITEYVRGPEGMEGDLRGWLGHPRLTLPVAVAMALQIAQGMQHAVRKVPNLVHRDLKPANILVNGDGKAMVTDFGLVQAAQSDAGTPAYMSPEQWRGDALDARSDIYAYGCILFEMFTAHRLFPASSERDWEQVHLERLPVTLTSLEPELPGEIDHFVRRCLEKGPTVRPQSWDEVVAFFAEWYHRLTGKAVVLNFSSLAFDTAELVDASYSLGKLNRHVEVLLICDRILAIDPNLAIAWYNKSLSLSDLKRYPEALEACDNALNISDKFVRAWLLKGNVFFISKRYEEAVETYDHAIALDPNDALAWKNCALALYRLKRYEESIKAYDKGLAIEQDDADAWNSKGYVLLNVGRSVEAVHAFDRALEIDQTFTFAWNNKGNALRDLRHYDEAIQAYDRALAINQRDPVSWYNKGLALHDLSLYKEAVNAFDHALAGDQHNPSVWRMKSLALRNLGRWGEAIKSLERLLAIEGNDAIAWSDKGDALTSLARYEEAIQAYDRALAINQSDAVTRNNKGAVLRALKRYREAIEVFDQTLTNNPRDEYALQGKRAAEDALKAVS